MSTRPVKKATRKSPRNSPTEIFKNIYGVEGTVDTPPVVVEFQRNLATERINFNHEMERGDLKYAPSDKNPYYMCLHYSQLADLRKISLGGCQWATPARYSGNDERFPRSEPDVALDSFFNVSLKLFYDMANEQVDWMALSNLEDPQEGNTPEERKKEAAVLKEMAFGALSDTPQRDPLDGKRYDEPDPVMQIEGEAIQLPPPLVYQNPPSTSSIDYEGVRWDHDSLKLHLGWEADQIVASFERLVGEINNGRSQPNTRLVPVTDEEVGNNGLLKMGENPFFLFTTYISVGDFNTYMQRLEVLTDAYQNLVRKDAHRMKRTSDPDLVSWLRGSYKPMETSKYTKPQNTARELYVKENKHGSTWRIGVSWDKVKEAGGKRIAEYAPIKIMGMSANVAAEKAFGWEILDQAKMVLGHEHRISSGMFMAEWLHLCAFSWGGLTTSSKSTKLVYRSSDIPENLIIGTSETNSVMTRFEKAWQALVRDESDLWIGGNSAFHAKLVVARNRNSENVVWDTKDVNTHLYGREEAPMTQTERDIAELFHFVAYTVSYSIEFPNGCNLLAMGPGSGLKTTFYPFLRPLYHRLEDQLDQVLYEKIKARYSDDFMSDGLKAMSFGIDPITTDGQILYDGIVQYGGATDLGTSPYTTSVGVTRKGNWKNAYNKDGETKKNPGVKPMGKR
ncbi:hypothetical protein FIE12Z_8109 [Fusarium flagelliforme]|uniref:Uncharacterized protein n=1 Tax=Fusarium flagelliforme TaxID=2675880 RepID=A0A395MIB0_9HYPO|nr:hypothetical protein FIE12Z_8109 [Fusarium flagelliforme]